MDNDQSGGTGAAYEDETKPVAAKQPNRWGLCDMHGNVYEWCQDWYDTYLSGPVTDPTGPETGLNHVVRGGDWLSNARFCRAAYRTSVKPDFASSAVGFRLALPEGQQ